MKKIIFFFVSLFSIASAETPPVDISFLVADLKYNEEQGVKICEIQQACISLFKGYDYIYKGDGLIAENFADVMSQFGNSFWFVSNEINYQPMKQKLLSHGWNAMFNRNLLFKNADFLKIASQPVYEPHNLLSYPAIVYMRPSSISNFDEFSHTYPGVVVIDRASVDYWKNKYKMSTLFLHHPDLEKVKPKWGLYPKKYNKALVEKIQKEINSETLVIKPKSNAEGRGVIIVGKDKLGETLKAIFTPQNQALKNLDAGYSYWYYDKSDTFLVEEFVSSDPIPVPEFDNRLFNCTMRVVFALIYHEKALQLHFLGEYWIVPNKSVDQKGTLNDKNKASMEHPHITAIDPQTRFKVKELLTKPFLLMYKRMLKFDEASLEEGIDSALVTGLDREI